ncbi:hypothetical protein JYU34_008848 [Plutella xylostella]|uniref:Condensin complex subunit 1 C-terminal domain-containing protein n=1 Tax=Plutella xylostella TaxID=51655 RepID=A0ABQ7QMH7_PLUXY|nr:hypothetical protein JYU34_008848 [Plutella xylostella]
MFLDAIVSLNMRRHLQKACAMLVKTGKCINHRIIDILSTHLGALDDARDLQTLVLLTSVAPHTTCEQPAFLRQYHLRLMQDLKSRDSRLLPLTIELLSSWSSWIVGAERVELRAHLIRALGTAQEGVDSCRIDCAALAAQLDPDNLKWADELMQIYTRGALSGGGAAEAVGAADLALVAAAPPAPRLLQLLLTRLQQPADMDEESEGLTVVAIGRLCVRSSAAAAAAAPLLARCLAAPRPLAPRVNALLALTDICARYTCIVEPLLDCICMCLCRSAEPALRRAAAPALTKLLLAGYLRLNTPFYYRYCALLADEEADVREPAEYYVTSCLTSDAIYKHFVECVLHYNKRDAGGEPISFDSRQLIYDVMLQRMSLVQKLNLQCRLAREVLEHAADICEEGDELPDELNDALLDTITLLCGIRMKLPRKPTTQGDPGDMEDLQERVTTNIVSHKMKRTVAEVLVPAVLRLYAHMRLRGGQLAAYLVRIATDLLKDYRQEIEELIENDEELVEKVRIFQETIGEEPSFGNTRNLVTSSTAHEPETPKSNKRRTYNRTPKAAKASAKRTLRV